jgi:hypothetical protein
MQSILATASHQRKLSSSSWCPCADITGPAQRGNRFGMYPEAHAGEGFMIV